MDTSREGGIKTVTFNGTNFNTWKYSVFIRLKEHDLVPIVEGTKPKPVEVILKKKKKRSANR